MGRHARVGARADGDTETIGLHVAGGMGLYPRPGESPEDVARWLDRSWTLFREVAMDDRLFGLMPYCDEVGSKPALDPYTGQRRGWSRLN